MTEQTIVPPLAPGAASLLAPLTVAELDATKGGALMIIISVFAFSAAIGIVDRLIFGGCRCG